MEKDYYVISIEGNPVGYLETGTFKVLDKFNSKINLEK